MAGDRISKFITNRRLRRTLSRPSFQILSISIVLLLFLRWILNRSNEPHDPLLLPVRPRPTAKVESSRIDWSKLQYIQYVKTPEELCNAVVIWSEIEEIGSRGQRLMVYPSEWKLDATDTTQSLTSTIARLLNTAAKDYYVKLRPLDVLNPSHPAYTTWSPYTKLLPYNLTEYNRLLLIDPASIVLQNLDELFLLPKAPLAMPYVSFGLPTGSQFSTHLMLIRPSSTDFSRVESVVRSADPKKSHEYDIISQLFPGQVLRIPQRPFSLLSGEFRRHNHATYLGSGMKWSPDKALQEAKILYFSDWPVPKPWVRAPKDLLNRYMPKCERKEWFGATNCRDRAIWLGLYERFEGGRRGVCGVGFELRSYEPGLEEQGGRGEWKFGVGKRR